MTINFGLIIGGGAEGPRDALCNLKMYDVNRDITSPESLSRRRPSRRRTTKPAADSTSTEVCNVRIISKLVKPLVLWTIGKRRRARERPAGRLSGVFTLQRSALFTGVSHPT